MPKEPEVSLMKLIAQLLESGVHYIGFVSLAIVGGLVTYLEKVRNGDVACKLLDFAVDLLGSGFTGLLVALLCIEYNLSTEITYFLVGISGHMGVRTLFIIRKALMKKFNLEEDK